jgi:WD40 repeat protein
MADGRSPRVTNSALGLIRRLAAAVRRLFHRSGGTLAPETVEAEGRYSAFLSYARTADAGLADALRYGLQRFAKRWYRMRARRVFLDEASLGATPLWAAVRAALDASDNFILLASPEARNRPWVVREVEYWLASKSPDTLLVGVTRWAESTDGAGLSANRDPGDLGAVVPSALAEHFETHEPRWVDLTWSRGQRPDPRDTRFRSAVVDLTVSIGGLSKDELVGEDVRQHRRQRTAIIVGLSVLGLALAGMAVLAIVARQAQAEADRGRDRAVAAQAASIARSEVSRDPALAARLALASNEIDEGSPAAVAALRAVVAQSSLVRTIQAHDDELTAIAVDERRGRLATASEGELRLWSLKTGELIASRSLPPYATRTLAFRRDSRVIATGGADGVIRLWAAPALREVAALVHHTRPVLALAFEPKGGVVSVSDDGLVLRWRRDGSLITPEARVPGFVPEKTVAAVADGGRVVALGDSESGRLRLVKVQGRRQIVSLRRRDDDPVVGLAFDSSTGRLIDSRGVLWSDTRPERPLHRFAQFGKASSAVASSGGGLFALRAPFGIELRRSRDGRLMKRLGTEEGLESDPLALARSGRVLVAANADGSVGIWNLKPTRAAIRLERPSTRLAAWDVDVDSRRAARPGNVVEVYATRGGRRKPVLIPRRATAVAFGGGGESHLAIASARGVELWDVAKNARLRVWPEAVRANTILFTPSGERLAVLDSSAGRVLFGDADDRRPRAIDPVGYILEIAMGQTGRALATVRQVGSRGLCIVETWDLATGKRQFPIFEVEDCYPPPSPRCERADYGLDAVAFDDLRGRVYLAFASGEIFRVSLGPEPTTSVRIQGRVTDFSPDGRRHVSCGLDGTAIAPTAQPIRKRLVSRQALMGRFSGDGRLVSVFPSSDEPDRLSVFEPGRGRLVGRVTGVYRRLAHNALARTGEGSRTIVMLAEDGGDLAARRSVVRWDTSSGRPLSSVLVEGFDASSVHDVSASGRRMAVSGTFGVVSVRQGAAGTDIGRLRSSDSPGDRRTFQVAGAMLDDSGGRLVAVWYDSQDDLTTRYRARGLDIASGERADYGLFDAAGMALSSDGELLAGLQDGRIQVLRTTDGARVWDVRAPFGEGRLDGMAFTEGGGSLTAWAGAEVATIHQGKPIERERVPASHAVVAVSEDGEVVVARPGTTSRLVLWDRTGGVRLATAVLGESDTPTTGRGNGAMVIARGSERLVLTAGKLVPCPACQGRPALLRAVAATAGRSITEEELLQAGVEGTG